MAQINVSFDTVTKDLNVSLNGAKIDNVSNVWIEADFEGKGFVELKTTEFMEDDKILKMTKIVADEVSTEIVEDDEVIQAIANFFNNKDNVFEDSCI